MEIILHRKTEYWNIARPYRVYIDGVYVGSLKNGQTKSFSVEDGQHTVMIKQSVSFFESKEIYIENNGASPIFLESSTSPIGILGHILLLLFFCFLIVDSYVVWNFNGILFSYILPVYLVFMLILFFGLAHRHIRVALSKPTD